MAMLRISPALWPCRRRSGGRLRAALSEEEARPPSAAGGPRRGRAARAAHRPAVGRRAGPAPGVRDRRVHAKIPGYVKGWTVNIGAAVKKGQVLAELSVPELEAELRQKEAAIEQAAARRKQAEAEVKVAQADVAGSEARLEGPGRRQAGRGRPRPLAGRAAPRRATVQRAGADRHAARRDPEQAPLGRGDPRGGPRPGQVGRGGPDPGPGRARPARSDVAAGAAAIDVATADANHAGRCSPTPRSRPRSTASSPSATSTPAT